MQREQELVLVVEADPPVRELLSDVLSDEGYEVMTAYDGDYARILAASRRVDVMTIDLDGPESTGGGLLREMSGTESGPCIVALSSARPLSCGARLAHAVLVKPFDVNELVEAVRRVLTSRRASRSATPAHRRPGRARAYRAPELPACLSLGAGT